MLQLGAEEPVSIPLHSPLYPPTAIAGYRGEIEGIKLLVQLPEDSVRFVLEPTPFDYIAPYAWIDVLYWRTVVGLAPYEVPRWDPYMNAGISVPARYGEITGSYCANYYKNKDYGMAPGRESAGYPIKMAEIGYQRTGRAVTASVQCPTANLQLSLVDGGATTSPPEVAVESPTLLIHQIPDVENPGDPLLRQIVMRDTAKSSSVESVPGEGHFDYLSPSSRVDDLGWLADGAVVAAARLSGSMQGSQGVVLATEHVAAGLLARNDVPMGGV